MVLIIARCVGALVAVVAVIIAGFIFMVCRILLAVTVSKIGTFCACACACAVCALLVSCLAFFGTSPRTSHVA